MSLVSALKTWWGEIMKEMSEAKSVFKSNGVIREYNRGSEDGWDKQGLQIPFSVTDTDKRFLRQTMQSARHFHNARLQRTTRIVTLENPVESSLLLKNTDALLYYPNSPYITMNSTRVDRLRLLTASSTVKLSKYKRTSIKFC